jgi:PKD repeat protein/photosystem II stability/assembly factor-like uncharacterized protein
MRQVYLDNAADNQIKKISFYNEYEGYIAFQNWIGYTQDSGKTFTKKYISTGNVDYNNYQVNLTFGFSIGGVQAFSKDTIITYGHYGFVPAILYSTDQGNTFKLVFHSSYNGQPQLDDGIKSIAFPETHSTGFAIDGYRVLKTVNGGLTWVVLRNESFTSLQFLNSNLGFVTASNKVSKTINSGATWTPLTVPPEEIASSFFLTENNGWLNTYKDGVGKVYFTSNGGNSWTLMSSTAYSSIVSAKMHFINDSTGYAVQGAFQIYKTTDSGRVWERAERLNNYEYLGYTHNDLFFVTRDHFWAGGGHGYLEMTTNGGGPTRPNGVFSVDVSTINTNNSVKLNNLSKTGYSYRWMKNSVLLATTYNASYISNRLTIDTISLVVIKGGFSDTSIQIVDTRTNQAPCKGAFTYLVDTALVKLTSTYNAYGVKHYWSFGDGITDSTSVNPVHVYNTVGTYNIKHVVKNTIDGCADSTVQSIQIIRLTNCLKVDITYKADTFYTNQLIFDFVQKPGTDISDRPVSSIAWNFGDGTSSGNGTHVFDSSKYYNVTLTLTHQYTGCVSKVVQPIFVFMEDGCNADFRIHTKQDPLGFFFSGGGIRFYGKPNSPNNAITNTWIFYNRDTIQTGNVKYFEKPFFTKGNDGTYFNLSGNSCFNETLEFNLDKLIAPVKHITSNTGSGCSDQDSSVFTVPTMKKVYIRPIPDPSFPNLVTFYSYSYNTFGVDSFPYNSRWRVDNGYGGGWTGAGATSSWRELFLNGANHNVAVASPTCGDGTRREVYYINYASQPLAPCAIYPPDFNYTIDPAQPSLVSFTIPSNVISVNSSLGWKRVLYFGNGDSSTLTNPTYNFPSVGVYDVKLKFTNSLGCVQEVMKQVVISATCNVSAAFAATPNTANPFIYSFQNKTKPDTTTVAYKWYFGSGDSSIAKNPAYTYVNAGRYTVRLIATRSATCFSIKDTTIVLTPLCPLNPAFALMRNSSNPALITFTNQTIPDSSNNTYKWYFGNGDSSSTKSPVYSYPAPGTFKVQLIAKRGICSAAVDTTILIPSQVVSITSFSPLSGAVGTIVTISGDNFSNVPAQNIVYFGAVRAIVNASSVNTLTVTAPAGATFEPITVTTNNLVAYAAKPFIVLFPGSSSGFTSSSFAPRIDSAAVSSPSGINICDVDGDGKADVSIASYLNSVSLRKNRSVGANISMAPAVSFAAPDAVRGIKYADFDGDGKKDMVAAIDNDFYGAAVFRNTSTNGTFSFEQPINISLGLGGFSIAAGDIDGDGKVDLAIIGLYANRVSVYKNTSSNGNISFAAPLTYTTATSPRFVDIADLDGDGKPELLVANNTTPGLSIFKNTSAFYKISFAARTDITVGASSMISTGDLNADGKPDIVSLIGGSAIISILNNTSQAGAISFSPKIDYPTAAGPAAIALSDLDGDGKPDIVVSNNSPSTISLFKNQSSNSAISFKTKVDYSTGGGPISISVADLNGDSKPDIAVLNANANTFSLFRNKINEPNSLLLCTPSASTILTSNLTGTTYTWQWDTCKTGSCYQNVSGSYFSGANTQTLQLTNVPSGWNSYKFRCIVDGTNSEEFELKFVNTWTGANGSAWENPTNWSCNMLPDMNTDVIINSGSVTLNSNISVRSLSINQAANLSVGAGYHITITH